MSKIPLSYNNVQVWDYFPDLRNVFSTSFLLQCQHVEWSPIKNDVCKFAHKQYPLFSDNLNYVYSRISDCPTVTLDVGVSRSEIKHYCSHHDNLPTEVVGNHLIKAKAFVSVYMSKFTGIVSIDISDNIIIAVRIIPNTHIQNSLYTSEFKQFFKKHYVI